MIEDTLIRHFRSIPQPHLSSEFSAQLRARLEATRGPAHRRAASMLLRRWAPRAYWIGAVAAAVEYVRPPAFAPERMAAIVCAGLLGALVVQRVLRPTALTRVLRDALR